MSEESCIEAIKTQSLMGKAETVKAEETSKLDAQKTAETKNHEPWYFTHV